MEQFWSKKAFLFLLLVVCGIFAGRERTSADTIYGSSNIGKYTTADNSGVSTTDSVVGVRLRMKKSSGYETVASAVDTWKKKGNSAWEYVGSDLDGEQGQYSQYMPTYSACYILNARDPRFGIIAGVAKNYMPKDILQDFSLVTEKYSQGKKTEQYAEYSFQSLTELSKREDSFMHQLLGDGSMLRLGTYSGDGVSYDFTIYPAVSIRQGGTISVDTGECTLTREGKAYYNGGDYYIKELPQVSQPKGYSLTIDGWYDSKNGGTRYKEGDLIQGGKTLYLRYKMELNQYTVQCLDMIGSQSGLQLGSSQWKQDYGTTATGAQAGAIPLADTYYPGMYYVGCTTGVVSENGITVYRFFQYASYPVTVIDIVNSGRQSGKTLGTSQKQCTYQQVVDGGSLLGNGTTEGLYYSGYIYSGHSSARVEAGGTTVYRYFTPITYSICFDGNGATEGQMDPLTGCEYGSTYSLPLNAYENNVNIILDLQSEDAVYEMGSIRLRREFKGWSENIGGNILYGDGAEVQNLSDCSKENVLYAIWDKAVFTTNTLPKRLGYQFAGWSERADADQGNTVLELTEDTTLYAIWKPDVTKYHVEYYKETLDGLFEKAAEYTFNDYSGKKITLENLEHLYPGFYLDVSSSVLSGTIRGDGSLILSAYYRRNTYTVQFDLDGGTVRQEFPILSGVYESTVRIPEEIPKKEHYQFMGWTADQGSTQVYCQPGDVYHVPNHDQTLYAVWKADSYQVYYMNDMDSEEIIQKQEYAFYEDIGLPDCDVVRRGYQFVGWKQDIDDGECYSAGQTLSSRFETKDGIVRFYAQWKPVSGTVVFDKNAPVEGTEVMGTVPSLEYVYDSLCTIPEETYFVTGYDFSGWNTEPDGSGDMYTPGMSLRNVFDQEGENRLYAIWTPSMDTKFVLILFKETLQGEGSETEEISQLKGETGQSIRNAILSYYYKDHIEEVFEGFEIDNPEVLDETVRADGSTVVKLHLSRRDYTVTVAEDFETDSYYSLIKCKYEESIVLEQYLEGVGSVARYIDRYGNTYDPGDTIQVLRDIILVPQHKVCYLLDGKIVQENYTAHQAYETVYQPEETAYRFDGWYFDEENGKGYCRAGDKVRVKQDIVFTGKWSGEKITYSIGYEMGSYEGVVALEHFVTSYQFGDLVLLPVKEQIYIPDKYEFVGWYEQGDSKRKIVKRIPAEAYGNKMYCLLLEERLQSDDTQEPSGSGSSSERPDLSETDQPNVPGNDTAEQPEDFGHYGDVNANKQDGSSPGIMSPIEGSTKQGSQNMQKNADNSIRFTKKKISYRILTGTQKRVMVVGADPSLRTVTIPSKVTWNHKTYSVTKIGNKAFYAHTALRKVIIGRNVKIIGKQAFANTKNLKAVILGKNVTAVKSKAFYKSQSLRRVIVKGKGVKKMGEKAFGKAGNPIRIFIPSGCEKKYKRLWKTNGVKVQWSVVTK